MNVFRYKSAKNLLFLFSFLILMFFFIWGVIYISKTEYDRSYIKATPNILWYNPAKKSCAKTKAIHCPGNENESMICNIHCSSENFPPNIDAYIFTANVMHKFPLYRNPSILWAFLHAESPRLNPIFMSEKLLSLFNFSATFSRYSDVPFPLSLFQSYTTFKNKKSIVALNLADITSAEYFVNTTMKNFHLKKIAPVLYIETNQLTFNDRKEYVLKLMEYISIDSYGKSLNNRKLPDKVTQGFEDDNYILDRIPPFLHYTARYKFAIAIENAICEDYITEKLWRPIEQGVVPIYFGSPSVRDWLPNKKSAILIEDFATPELLAQFLHGILRNDTKYEEYLEHKTKGLITNQRFINEFKTRPYQTSRSRNDYELSCFLCSRLHEGQTDIVNKVTRKALDCKMPLSLLTHEQDRDNNYTALINEWKKDIDDVYDKYLKGIPLERTNNSDFSNIPSLRLRKLLKDL